MSSKCLAAFTALSVPDGSLVPYINAYEEGGDITVRVRSWGVDGTAPEAWIVLTQAEWVSFITDSVMNGSPEMNLLLVQACLSKIKTGLET
jgi:hypothetical protein